MKTKNSMPRRKKAYYSIYGLSIGGIVALPMII
jgi:hypothetical protein